MPYELDGAAEAVAVPLEVVGHAVLSLHLLDGAVLVFKVSCKEEVKAPVPQRPMRLANSGCAGISVSLSGTST